MALEYYIPHPCVPQAGRAPLEFMQRAGTRRLALYAKAVLGKNQDVGTPLDEREITLAAPVQTLLGKRTTLRYGLLRDTWERIERKSLPHCRECPLNFQQAALGCHGRVTYPLSQAGEQWLMAQFNPPAGEEASYVAQHIRDTGCSGATVDGWRGPPLTSREQGEAIALPPGPATKELGDRVYTSSQVIEFLLGCQPVLINQTLLGLLADFGAIRVEEAEYENLFVNLLLQQSGDSGAVETMPEVTRDFRMRLDPGEDQTISQLKQLFLACHRALMHGRSLFLRG